MNAVGKSARSHTTHLHVAHDAQVGVVGLHRDVRLVQVFQYFKRHARVAELEQFERRGQVELGLVNAGRHVIRQIWIVQILRTGILQSRRQEVYVQCGLLGQMKKTNHGQSTRAIKYNYNDTLQSSSTANNVFSIFFLFFLPTTRFFIVEFFFL